MPTEVSARTLLNYAMLQSVAESYLQNWEGIGGPLSLERVLLAGSNNTVVTGASADAAVLSGATRLTQTQIDYFNINYDIVAHYPSDLGSGFSCTLFRNLQTGEYTLSFRSTEYPYQSQGGDWERDGSPGADGDIGSHGFALAQLAAMEEVYSRFRRGEVWRVDPVSGVGGWVADPNTDANSAHGFAAAMQAGTGALDVTGYSLGAHLSTAFTLMHDEVRQAYNFNAAGLGGIGSGLSFRAPTGADIADLVDGYELLVAWNGELDTLPADARYDWIRTAYAYREALPNAGPAGPPPAPPGYLSFLTLIESAPVALTSENVYGSDRHHVVMEILGAGTIGSIELGAYSTEYLLANYVASGFSRDGFRTDMYEVQGAGWNRIVQVNGHGGFFDPEIVANSGYHATPRFGAGVPIEDLPMSRGLGILELWSSVPRNWVGDFGETHSIALLTDALVVIDLFERMDALLGAEGFRSLLAAASHRIDEFDEQPVLESAVRDLAESLDLGLIAEHLLDDALHDADALENLVNALGRLFLGPSWTPIEGDYSAAGYSNLERRDELHQAVAHIAASSGFQLAIQGGVAIVPLAGMSALELADRAQNDIAYRYALLELNPFVVTSALVGDPRLDSVYAVLNADGRLDEENFSSAYLIDRASLLYWRLQYASGALDSDDLPSSYADKPFDEEWDAFSATEDTHFILHEDGGELRFTVDGDGGVDHVIAFGDESDNVMMGLAHSDRLYGEGGNDVLTGGGGDDHLEGGHGNDTLVGGVGNDVLDGGAGEDTYRIVATDGNETVIADRDRGGVIFVVVDGVETTLTSPTRRIDEMTWRSEDGRFTYRLSPNADGLGGQDLLIFVTGHDSGSSIIRITNYRDAVALRQAGRGSKEILPAAFGIVLPEAYPSAAVTPFSPDGVDEDYSDDPRDGTYELTHLRDRSIQGEGNDIIIGDNVALRLSGQAGSLPPDAADWIEGNGGDDALIGWSGRDRLEGGSGNDSLYGEGRYLYQGNQLIAPDISELIEQADTLIGGAGQDRLIGEVGDDLLYAGELLSAEQIAEQDRTQDGSGLDGDALEGGAGNDLLVGDAGEDVLLGGAGDDTLWGGGGADLIMADRSFQRGSGTNHYVGLPDGPLTLTFTSPNPDGSGSYGYELGPGASIVTDAHESHGRDMIHGGRGDDRIYAGGGADYVDGGADNDLLLGEGGSDQLFGGDGNDVIEGDEASNEAAALARGGADVIDGGAGNDQLFGGSRGDQLRGGDGDDFLAGDRAGSAIEYHGEDRLDGGAGNDVLYGYGGNDQLIGGSGNDQLIGDETDSSPGGDDRLDGGAGQDTLRGNAGADWLSGGADADTLYGGSGDDELLGGDGNDSLSGDAGDDILDGGSGSDLLIGGAGNDRYRVSAAGSGTVQIIDGDGASYIEIDAASADAVTSVMAGDDLVLTYGQRSIVIANAFTSANTLRFSDAEMSVQQFVQDRLTAPVNASTSTASASVFGGAGSDTLQSTGGNSVFSGGRGDDTFIGALTQPGSRGGNVYHIAAGSGNDTIRDYGNRTFGGVLNANVVRFGTGITRDQIEVRYEGGTYLTIRIGASQSVRLQFSTVNPLTDFAVDRFEFEDGTALTWAQLLADGIVIEGTNAANTLSGTALRDLMRGLDGNDSLSGGAGDDQLDGGAGNDQLFGHGGNDEMRGGLGDDTYYVEDAGDLVIENVGEGNDTVRATVTTALVDQVENLILIGGSALNGTGNALANRLEGNAAANELRGGAGDDTLLGLGGNDLLMGQSGNDALDGGAGNDTYRYARGDGDDVITNTRGTGTETDTLHLTDVLAAEISGYRLSNDLMLVVPSAPGGTATIRLAGFFGAAPIDRVQFSDGAVWTRAELISRYANAFTDAVDTVVGTDAADVFDTLGGNDRINAGLGNDVLLGDAGDDTIYGEGGDDTLDGGIGIDRLEGGTGNDTLILRAGDRALGGTGNDVYRIDTRADFDSVIDNSRTVGSGQTDVLRLGAGILPGEVLVRIAPAGLELVLSTGESLMLVNFMAGSAGQNEVDRVEFADGTVWTGADLYARAVTLVATPAADTLVGYGRGDLMLGLAGRDRLTGNAGDDTLDGGSGNDTLVGGDDHDRLIGGSGDDRLEGGAGNDEYTIAGGSGVDTVVDSGGTDTLALATGIDPSQVQLVRVLSAVAGGDSLIVVINNGEAEITVQGHFSASGALERIQFADGTVWNAADIAARLVDERQAVVVSGTSRSSSHSYTLPEGSASSLTLTGTHHINGAGNSGANMITGNAGHNVLDGGFGLDTLIGGAGNDYYIVGNGQAQASPQIDSVVEQAGGGVDTVEVRAHSYVLPMHVENLIGTSVSGWILHNGVVQPRRFVGNASNNVIDLSSITVPAGGDTSMVPIVIDGGDGDDVMIGSGFDDAYTVDSAGDVIEEWATASIDTVNASVSYTLGTNLEHLNLSGSSGLQGIGNALSNRIRGGHGADLLEGGDGDDELIDNPHVNANDSGDILRGGRGSDILISNSGSDTLDGGEGDDTMSGGNAATRYVFVRGHGSDLVRDTSSSNAQDVVEFGDVAASEVRFARDGMDLVITSNLDPSDRVRISQYFQPSGEVNPTYEVEQFAFSEGVVLGRDEVLLRVANDGGMRPSSTQPRADLSKPDVVVIDDQVTPKPERWDLVDEFLDLDVGGDDDSTGSPHSTQPFFPIDDTHGLRFDPWMRAGGVSYQGLGVHRREP